MTVKRSFGIKLLIFLLAVLIFAGAACMAAYQLIHVSTLWGEDDYNYSVHELLYDHTETARGLIWYYLEDPEDLSVFAAQVMKELEQELSASATNFRWLVQDEAGEYLWGNAEALPDDPAHLLKQWVEGYVGELAMYVWVDSDLPVEDGYRTAVRTLAAWKECRAAAAAGTAALAVLGIALTVWLCVLSGYRKGHEGVSLCWFHRIPGDLLLAVWIAAGILLAAAVSELGWAFGDLPMPVLLLAVGAVAGGYGILILSLLTTVTARCRGRILLRQTVIGWLLMGLWRGAKGLAQAIPLVWKTALGAVVYLALSIVLFVAGTWNSGWFVVWAVLTLAVLGCMLWWALQWKRIRVGTSAIIGGNTGYRIDTAKMPPDLKAHGEELNNLGVAIGAAVEERMRSEHFKAELITNVSHDLKTPLTSIINYVDLLKKEEIGNPRAAEYIEVLDRKSQRLKKLTEDLVEASKASTGAVSIVKERLDLCQLVGQALAEYEERLQSAGLAAVCILPDGPVWVEADGRHLWRVMDNLLSNCGKYALAGTRVYVEVQSFSDCVRLSVKNISREPLNMEPERLVERFVRGDESRTAEGSGLGLSIARSLTELQGGTFELAIDGDLFKATVTLRREEKTDMK